MTRMQAEYAGNIAMVRAVEDAIRATHKYTEGVGTLRAKHPVQGEDFPSRVFCKYYEVYPDIEVSWEMPAGVALDWLWGNVRCVDVVFTYDYRSNQAKVVVKGGDHELQSLFDSVPGFRAVLRQIARSNGVHDRPVKVVAPIKPSARMAQAPSAADQGGSQAASA